MEDHREVHMALIQCPECNQEISDKAQKCIHCGHVLQEVEEQPAIQDSSVIKCKECGEQLADETVKTCPRCGCPVELSEDEKRVAEEKQKKKHNKRIASIAVAVAAVVVIAIIAGISISKSNETNSHNDYVIAYNAILSDMLNGAADAESVTNDVKRVWNSAITESSRYRWDDDIEEYYSTDFNTALAMMYADSKYVTKVNEIKSNQELVKSDMQKLQGAPDDFSNAYATIDEMYDNYLKYTELAVSPSGSYQSYSTETNQLASDFLAGLKKAQTQIPEEKD